MVKNELARRIDSARRDGLRQGLKMGHQYIADVMIVCLHKRGWGYDRIKSLLDDMDKSADYYADAFIKCMEQDARQEQLDNEIRAVVKDRQEFYPFAERYPNVGTLGYGRLPAELWKQVEKTACGPMEGEREGGG